MIWRSIGFKIGLSSALVLLALGVVITGYSLLEMRDMAVTQRDDSVHKTKTLMINTAREQAALIEADIENPLNAARTLSQTFTAAARRDPDRLTENDLQRLKNQLQHMEMASAMALSAIQDDIEAAERGEVTREEAQRSAIEKIRNLRYDDDNYVWIHDLGQPVPRMIMHPLAPSLEGRLLDDPAYDTALNQNKNVFVALNEVTEDTGSGYVHYKWPKPGEQEPTAKLSFARRVPEWGWVLGSGLWIDQLSFFSRVDVEQILRAVLLENTLFLATFTVWEPDAFDGKDGRFANTDHGDAQGRFAAGWVRVGSGEIQQQPPQEVATLAEGDVFLSVKAHNRPFVSPPRLREIAGQKQLTVTASAPIVVDGAFRGIAGVIIDLDRIAADVTEAARALSEAQAQVAVIAADGKVVADSAHPESVGQPVKDLQPQGREIEAAIARGEPIQLESMNPQGEQTLSTVVPIDFGYRIPPWGAQVSVPIKAVTEAADAALAQSRQSAMVMAVFSILAVLAGTAITSWTAHAAGRRIRRATSMMEDIAQGEGDLRKQLPETGEDEISQLSRAFNLFQQRVRELISEIARGSDQLAAAAEELSAASTETSSQVNRQQSEADQVATAMNQMTATVAEVARNAATAAESAQSADRQASSGSETVANTIQAIQQLSAQIESSTDIVKELSHDSETIGQVLDVIRSIADQTNLLALNAAIEAARAGEQGRGFAVVADEVRTLASRTQASTQEIQSMIERLQSGAGGAVKAMEQARSQAQSSVGTAGEAGDALGIITQSVASIRDMNTQIASATEQQSAVAADVDRNLVNSSQAIEAIASGASQINNAAIELAQLAAEQQARVSRFKT